ncbi:MAG: glutathione peroxidase [Halieaceae bacterium]|nr:glutathione peroxidase [Halieaceae bacterium]
MKKYFLKYLALLLVSVATNSIATCPDYLDTSMRKLHSSENINFCDNFSGKPILIVNTASYCGFKGQFRGLESLHKTYGGKGLAVIGFASDSFNQEASDEEQAADVCFKNFGVTFTMMATTSVVGEDANPVFSELGRQTQPPGWNFNKYLVDRTGKVVKHYKSSVSPAKLRGDIESIL